MMLNKLRSLSLNTRTLSATLLFCGWLVAARANADFVLTLGLGAPVVTTNQVTIPIQALYTNDQSDPTQNYVETFVLDMSLSSSALNTALSPSTEPFSRFSFANTLPNWLGPAPADTGQSLLISTNQSSSLVNNSGVVKLADLVIDVSGIGPGEYTASIFRAGFTSAVGVQEGVFFDSQTYTGSDTINLNAPGSASFTITAVPEPSSIVGFTALMSLLGSLAWRRLATVPLENSHPRKF
jgi:hypothetical protein